MIPGMKIANRPLLVLAVLLALSACARKETPREGAVPTGPLAAEVRASLAANPEAARTRVLVLGFDGADFDILDPLIEAGELPNFARVKREGAWGKLRSITPLLSPVIWTTIATGKGPAEHGILDFVVRDPKTGEMLSTPSYNRRVLAVWNILGAYGRSVGVVGWMVTWPAEPVNGFLISDLLDPMGWHYGDRTDERREQTTWPPSLAGEIESSLVTVDDVTFEEVRRFLDIPVETFRKTYARAHRPGNLVNNFRLLLAAARTFQDLGLGLWKERKPDFQATYFEFFDACCHTFMPYAPPRRDFIDPKDYEKYHRAVAEVCRFTDRQLGAWLDAADENTVVLVVSDHGFRSGRQRLREGSEFRDKTAALWHRPYGIFLAWGRGVRKGARVKGASVYDITPTILGLMGFPAAEDMRGRFLSEAFERKPPAARVKSYESGRREEVIRRMRKVVAKDDPRLRKIQALGYLGGTDTTGGHLNLAANYLSEGKLDEALKEYQAASLQDPASGMIHLNIGDVYLRMSEWEKALREYQAAASLDPSLVQARLREAVVLRRLGRKERALQLARDLVRQEPENVDAHVELGTFLQDAGEVAEAESMFRKALELEPDSLEARNRLGLLLLKTGRYEAAEKEFSAALDLEPAAVRIWNNLAVTRLNRAPHLRDPQEREQAFDRALETLNLIIERFPDYPNAYYNRAQLRELRGQRDRARQDLEKALRLRPDYPKARALLRRLAGR